MAFLLLIEGLSFRSTKTKTRGLSFRSTKTKTWGLSFRSTKTKTLTQQKELLTFNENLPAEKAYRPLESISATKYSRHKQFIDRTQENISRLCRTRSFLFCHANLTIKSKSASVRCSRVICLVSLAEKTLQNLNSKLSRIVKQRRYDRPVVLAETMMGKNA